MVATRKLEELEKEIQNLKSLMLFGEDSLLERKLVSLRDMGKLLVSEEELEKAMNEVRRSLFKATEDVVRH